MDALFMDEKAARLEEKNKTLEQYALFMDEMAVRLEEMNKLMQEKNNLIQEKNKLMQEKNKFLEASADVTVELARTIAMQAEKITQPVPINALSHTHRACNAIPTHPL